jgi:hypothetical protein
MSITTRFLKTAIKLTPNKLIIWVANVVLKDIAELTAFDLDLDTRKTFVQTKLNGEQEVIDVWVDGFAVISEDGAYHLIINKADSNKPWLNNILARIIGKPWKIPAIPKFQAQIDLVAELLKPEPPEQPL